MSKVLIIGCGGVANVAIRKCCQCDDLFTDICIASRTKSKCDALKADLEGKTKTRITTAQVNADDASQVAALIREYQPDLVMNIALPYQDLAIMDACLECGVNYLDTANYEPGGHGQSRVARHLREALRGGWLFRLLRLQLAVGLPREVREGRPHRFAGHRL